MNKKLTARELINLLHNSEIEVDPNAPEEEDRWCSLFVWLKCKRNYYFSDEDYALVQSALDEYYDEDWVKKENEMKESKLKYKGSIGWLIFWALFLPPVALILVLFKTRFVSKED